MSNNIASPDAPSLPYYVATYQGRSVAVKRDADYQNTIKLVQKSIAKLRGANPQDILISTTLADYDNALVQISEEIWPDVVGDIRTVEITLDDPTDVDHPAFRRADDEDEKVALARQDERVPATMAIAEPIIEYPRSSAVPYQSLQTPTNRSVGPSDTFSITVRTASQQLLKLDKICSLSTVGDVKSLIETTYNVPAILQRLDLHGQPLDDSKTLEQCKITDWTILDLHLNARQYMISFYPDLTLQTTERFRHKGVEVKLSLNRAWELAALRPSRESLPKDYSQCVSWTVDVTWGELFDHDSYIQLAHLFWDGTSHTTRPIALDLPFSQTQLDAFVPLLDPTNSVAVAFDQVAAYTDNILSYTGFPYYQRFPPHFVSQLNQKTHAHIALRFVAHADCEKIASLSISPPTSCVTQILILYKGLSAAAAQTWENPRPRYAQGADPWKEAIGARSSCYSNTVPGLKVFGISWMEVC
ncbi:hypothetical protein FRC08_016525 [Ceratobasidium sp. 394]|nr:hypothetical protein FRC08_016525 [Ceratobasidium sp. 394]